MAISTRMWLGGAAAIILAAGLTGCNSSSKSASPGVVGKEKSACCSESGSCTESGKASPGELGAKKSDCCSEGAKASPGVMSSGKTGSCSEKSAACPAGAGSCSSK